MGSATTVANRDIKQQSVGVAVKHHAPTMLALLVDDPKTK